MPERTYPFSELIDIHNIQKLMDAQYAATGIPIGLLGVDGTIYVAAGWQEICTRFHRQHPDSVRRCQESDRYIQQHLQEDAYIEYKCQNGLWDLATPIIVKGAHLATLFLGQFFYENEQPDIAYFTAQAAQFGFDADEYLATLQRIPVFTRQHVRDIMAYYVQFVHLLVELGMNRLKQEQTEEELRASQDYLEDIVEERTAQLHAINVQLELDLAERQRVEAALRKSEAQFRAVIDLSPIPYALNDDTQHITYLNAAFTKTFGYDLTDIPTLADWWPRAYPDPAYRQWVADTWQARLDKAKADGTDFEPMELNVRCKDGSLRTALVSAGALGESLQDIHLVILYDITARKQAEEALKARETELRTLINAIPDLVWLKSAEGVYLKCNQRFETFFGATEQEIVGKTDYDFMDSALADFFRQHDQVAMLAGQPTINEEHITFASDGHQEFLETIKTPVYDNAGRVIGVLGIGRNISTRKRMEQQLRESEARARAMLSAIPDMMFRMNREGVYIDYKADVHDLFSQSAAIIGAHNRNITPPEFADLVDEKIRTALETGALQTFEYQLPIPNKGLREYEARMIASGEDEVTAIVRDITERKRHEVIQQARLRLLLFAATHSLEELLQMMVDELERLTGSVLGFFHFLEADQQTLRLQTWSTNTLSTMCHVEEASHHYDLATAGVWVDCVRTRAPIIHNDYPTLPHRKGLPPGHAPVIRELTVPIIRHNRIMAIIGVGNKPQPYTAEDVENMMTLGDLAWDITARKQAEEQLRESEAKFRNLIEKSPIPLCFVNTREELEYFNPRFTELFGYEHADVPTLAEWWQLAYPDATYRQRVLETWNEAIARSARDHTDIESIEYLVTCKNGHARNVAIGGIMLDNGFLATFIDVTERKRVEEALRNSEERRIAELAAAEARLRSVIENSADGIMILDQHGVVRFHNPAASRLFNNPELDLNGKVFGLPIPSAEKSEVELFRPNQTPVTVEIRLTEIEWNGEPLMLAALRDITERKQAEDALRESKSLYESLVNHLPQNLYRIDLEGKLLFINKTLQQALGLPLSAILGKTAYDFYPAALACKYRRDDAMVVRTGKPLNEIEENVSPLTGKSSFVEVMKIPVHDNNGKVCGIQGIFQDITERRRAEEALRASELRYRQLAATAPVGIYRTDASGSCIYVNARWCELTGMAESAAMGDGWTHALHPEDRLWVLQTWAAFTASQQKFDGEYRFLKPNGAVVWVTGSAAVETDHQGKVIGHVGTITDISTLKQTENALWEVKWRLEVAASAGIIGIWDLDLIKNHLFWDSVMYKLYGIRAEDWDNPHEAWLNAVHPDDRAYVESEAQAALRGEREYAPEFRIIWPDGSIHYIKSASKTIFNADGQAIRMVGVNYDLTEQKQVEAALAEARDKAELANRAKSEFLATMSHEIRTPMNALLGFTAILDSKITDPQHRHYLSMIQASGQSLMSLLNDILDLSKIEAGKLQLTYTAVNLQRLCEDVIRIFSQRATEKGVELTSHFAPDLPDGVLIDEIRLRQILLNLVGNAVKFTERGTVTVEATMIQTGRAEESTTTPLALHIAVCDTGIGIPLDQQAVIFGDFVQVHGQSARYGGTGLGLPITRRLVEAMGGNISVSSNPGQGSTFTVRLPEVRRAEGVIAEMPLQKPTEAVRFEAATILIVDDVADNRQVLLDYLEEIPAFHLLEAADGRAAIELARQHRPELILMDMRMPNLNGYEATRILKQETSTREIPVIAVTASSMKEQAEQIVALCDGYLRKPLDKADLLDELRKFLPYTLVQETTPAAPSAYRPDAATLPRLPELAHTLETVYLPRCQELQEFLIMDEVKEFTGDLLEFARQAGVLPMIEYAEELMREAERYQVSNVKQSLAHFQEQVDQITHALNAQK